MMPTYQQTLETGPTTSESWSNPTSPSTHAGVFYTHLTTSTQPAKQAISAFIESGANLKTFIRTTEGHWQKAAEVLASRPKWQDVEYRQAYAEAAVEQGIAWQVRVNRERRGLTQSELATKIETHQSAVSRIEDPEYGSHSLQQLVKVAHAFDCALIVKFVSYAVLARESECLSPDQLFAPSYTEETGATL
jgi:ribosome-binding protein aMBF1 (putative translation factor)